MGASKPKLLELVRQELKLLHYSPRTEKCYVNWIVRNIIFHQKRHTAEMGKEEIRRFLNHLILNRHVSASTQNQALQAILFLYKNVLLKDIEWIDDIKKLQRVKNLPVVFSKNEVKRIFEHLNGTPKIIVSLLYGGGL